MHVRFNSNVPRHNRVLTAEDFKRLGVEHKKIDVQAGETIEVPDEIGTALIGLDEFSEVEAPAKTEDKPEADGEQNEPATTLQEADASGESGSGTGANTRDGAGARSTRANR